MERPCRLTFTLHNWEPAEQQPIARLALVQRNGLLRMTVGDLRAYMAGRIALKSRISCISGSAVDWELSGRRQNRIKKRAAPSAAAADVAAAPRCAVAGTRGAPGTPVPQTPQHL